MDREAYSVVETDASGKHIATISGMGRNAGKIDCNHSQRTAQRHAATLRKENPDKVYKVVANGYNL